MRTKVAPPVTPRIVQERHGQRLLRYGAVVGAFLLAVWLSYDYGRGQAPPGIGAPLVEPGEAQERISELEQERDALQQQVEKLEQRVTQANQSLAAAQSRAQSLQQTRMPTPAREIAVREPTPTPTPAPVREPERMVSEPVDNELKLENVDITQTDSQDVFRIGFSVMHAGNNADRVTGTIWIAVNGFVNGKPTRLSLKALSPQRRPFVKMGFEMQQDVQEEVVLPENFRPKNVLIEAKPYGERYSATAETVSWDP